MSILVKNGHIFAAVDSYVADILVDDGKVRTIGIDLAADADKTIDATGKYVMPGGIDPHTHLDFPFGGTVSSDDFRTGTIAAAYGGTTSIVDFAVQQRGHALSQALEMWHQKAEGKAAIDYGFHMIILDLSENRLPELDGIVRQGVTSFKMFMAYLGAVTVDDTTIFQTMVSAADNGAPHKKPNLVAPLASPSAVSLPNYRQAIRGPGCARSLAALALDSVRR